MTPEILSSLIGGLAQGGPTAGVIAASVWFFFKKMNSRQESMQALLMAVDRKIDAVLDLSKDLHEWHDKEDVDGVKVWYIRASLTAALTDLNTILAEQGKAMTSMGSAMSQVVNQLSDMQREFHEHTAVKP